MERDLLELSLEELSEIEVTSVSGVSSELFSSPAALTVITAEDIRRSGHQTLVDALRLVPGMFIGQSSSSFWKAGGRGFTGAALPAPRNLVLIDGRTVYDPLFGGVFWDVQDVLLEDVDRIEVIRGPGATLWGANAVNGVVNIITKNASETQGALVVGGGGTYYEGFGAVRYGGTLGDQAWYRAYLKYFTRDAFDPESQAGDDWSMLRGGFRVDGFAGELDYTVQGDIYGSISLGAVRNEPVPGAHLEFNTLRGDDELGGGNLLGRLSRRGVDGSGWAMQVYYDRTDRERIDGFQVERDTFDLDLRHAFDWLGWNEAIWGFGYRVTDDSTDDSESLRIDPTGRTFHLVSTFAQNTSELVTDRLFFMIGSKLTYFSETKWELQPGARLWWVPNNFHTLWAAISSPVRHPTRIELHGDLVRGYADPGLLAGREPTGMIVPVELNGNAGLNSERLVSYELGYRGRLREQITFDGVVFYNDYHSLISAPPNQIGSITNLGDGESYGVETVLSLQPFPIWQVKLVYSFLEVDHSGPVLQFEEINFEQNQARASSYLDIGEDLELNILVYYVDRVPLGNITSYVRLDVGTTWRPHERIELALWGQDILHDGHEEYSALEYPRGFYVQGTFRF